jgi:hypothetical protein|tara:strand:+ start:4076 stop:4315 length:240 start_codon:yes stop_codon:yes gene_type:complete
MASKKTINQMSRQMGVSSTEASDLMTKAKKINDAESYKDGGSIEWGRQELDRDTEELIKGTDYQVRGRYFNNNDGKGTF